MDWSKPVTSLLSKFQREGYAILGVSNGEETIKIPRGTGKIAARKSAVAEVTSVDASTVVLHKEGRKVHLFIVLGNEPDEILSDYSFHPDLREEVEELADEFATQWSK